MFHENRVPADDSHEISFLICIFEKRQNLKLSSAANYRCRFKGWDFYEAKSQAYIVFLQWGYNFHKPFVWKGVPQRKGSQNPIGTTYQFFY